MKLIDSSYDILRLDKERDVEMICRGYCICYNTPLPKTYEEQCEFIRKHIKHTSPLEHSIMTVLFTINRGISHELVRHRHTGYSMESTRYCNYSNNRFNNEIIFIKDSASYESAINDIWEEGLKRAEAEYFARLDLGQTPEEARGCLPIDLATKILVSTNFREWISIFNLRCDSAAHYQMREVMKPLSEELQKELPCIFGNFNFN